MVVSGILLLPKDHLHGHQPGDHYCQIELAGERLADCEHAGNGTHWSYVSISDGGKRYKAKVTPVSRSEAFIWRKGERAGVKDFGDVVGMRPYRSEQEVNRNGSLDAHVCNLARAKDLCQ